MLFERFFPKEYVESTYSIDFEKMYEKGFRGIIFDIDNTLVPHGADATPEAIELFEKLKRTGFDICLLSNNKKPRVERFNKDVNVKYIFKAQKPITKNYLAAAIMMRCRPSETICVGDQIFTDIHGANKSGIYSILVKPVSKINPFQVKLKRILEKPVLLSYLNKVRVETKPERLELKAERKDEKALIKEGYKEYKAEVKETKADQKAEVKAEQKELRAEKKEEIKEQVVQKFTGIKQPYVN